MQPSETVEQAQWHVDGLKRRLHLIKLMHMEKIDVAAIEAAYAADIPSRIAVPSRRSITATNAFAFNETDCPGSLPSGPRLTQRETGRICFSPPRPLALKLRLGVH